MTFFCYLVFSLLPIIMIIMKTMIFKEEYLLFGRRSMISIIKDKLTRFEDTNDQQGKIS